MSWTTPLGSAAGVCSHPWMTSRSLVELKSISCRAKTEFLPRDCSRSERDSMQSRLQQAQLIAELRVRSGDVDVGCDGVDRQRQNGAGGKTPFLAPRRQLFAAAGVDDSPEPDPSMGRRAPRAAPARRADRPSPT